MQNYILYPTPFFVIEMLNKEGATIDTVFCPPSICVPNPENPKNIKFLP